MDKFWKTIQYLDWDSHHHCDIVNERLNNQSIMDIDEFIETYDSICCKVNREIVKRYKSGQLRASKGNELLFSNDYTFMDLPAHIVSKGEKYVKDFIKDKDFVIDFVAVECFSYGIHAPDSE